MAGDPLDQVCLPPAADILDAIADAVIYADREGIIRAWNRGAEALFGYPAEAVLGQSLDLIIPDHLRAAHWRGYAAAMAAGATRHGRRAIITRAVSAAGEALYVDMSFAVVLDRRGEASGSVAVARDAGERVRAAKRPGPSPAGSEGSDAGA